MHLPTLGQSPMQTDNVNKANAIVVSCTFIKRDECSWMFPLGDETCFNITVWLYIWERFPHECFQWCILKNRKRRVVKNKSWEWSDSGGVLTWSLEVDVDEIDVNSSHCLAEPIIRAIHVKGRLVWPHRFQRNRQLTKSYDVVVEVDKKCGAKALRHWSGEQGPHTPVVVISRQLKYFRRPTPTTAITSAAN